MSHEIARDHADVNYIICFRCRSEHQNLINKKHQKLNVLQRENPDTYNAVLWLRQNKKRFKGS